MYRGALLIESMPIVFRSKAKNFYLMGGGGGTCAGGVPTPPSVLSSLGGGKVI